MEKLTGQSRERSKRINLGRVIHNPPTSNITKLTLPTRLEANVAIIAACIPTLKPLSKLFSSTFVSIRQRYPRRSGYISQTENDQPLQDIKPSRPSRFSCANAKPSNSTSERSSVGSQDPNVIKKKTEVHMTVSDEEEQLGGAEHDYSVFPTSREAFF